ncbi:MAG: hypothetical protein ISS79_13220, partial [Phycisphaerae bacterium]|nr:hypothetical protein [Phycisphaerae bacterium]
HGQLRKRGIVVAAATIVTLLSENAAQAAPAAVLRELAKMALAGAKLSAPTGGSAAGICETTAAIGGLFLAAKVKIIVVALVVGIGAVGVLTHRHFTRPVGNSDATVVVEKAPASSNAPVVSHPPVVEPDRSPPPAEPIRRNEASAAAEPQSPEPAQDQQLIQEPPRETATEEDQTPALDLSSPEATVRTFIKRFVAGDAESVLACCLPGGTDYEDIQEILFADPADPAQRDEYQFRLWFQALDPDAEMPIISKQETPRGISVTWLVTFKTEFAMPGRIFAPGEQMELDGTVVQSDGKWLIDGI